MSKNSVTALGNIPKDVQQHVRDLLSITPSLRPDVHQMSKVGWLCKSKKESLQPVTLHIPLEVLISCTSNRKYIYLISVKKMTVSTTKIFVTFGLQLPKARTNYFRNSFCFYGC